MEINMNINAIIFFLICIFYQPIFVYAQHNHDAHTHGEGRMTLVFDKGQMLVEIKTPAANMLGFEHTPNSDEQWHTLDVLEQALRDPKKLIVLEPDCKLQASNVKLPFERAHKESTGSDSEVSASKAEHEHHHENEHHAAHPKKGENTSSHVNHTDIYIEYEWLCEKPYLPKLTLHYFDAYPSFNRLNVEWIVNGAQGATPLHKSNNILEITQ